MCGCHSRSFCRSCRVSRRWSFRSRSEKSGRLVAQRRAASVAVPAVDSWCRLPPLKQRHCAASSQTSTAHIGTALRSALALSRNGYSQLVSIAGCKAGARRATGRRARRKASSSLRSESPVHFSRRNPAASMITAHSPVANTWSPQNRQAADSLTCVQWRPSRCLRGCRCSSADSLLSVCRTTLGKEPLIFNPRRQHVRPRRDRGGASARPAVARAFPRDDGAARRGGDGNGIPDAPNTVST